MTRQANLRYINRDALAVLLGLAGSAAPAVPSSTVLDIRRYDERTLYGSIPGTKHIPGASHNTPCLPALILLCKDIAATPPLCVSLLCRTGGMYTQLLS